MSNVIPISQFKLFQPRPASFALPETDKKIAGLEWSAEQLRDRMAAVTKYIENLRLDLEAQASRHGKTLKIKFRFATRTVFKGFAERQQPVVEY